MGNNKWCTTVDGKEINLFDPDPSIFTVDRIANALARINRFAGCWVQPVSVARHSIRVAEQLCADGRDIEIQLQGLFHDAAEAFTTDIPSPFKKLLSIETPTREFCLDYYKFEDVLLSYVFKRLKIEHPLRPEVHEMDKLQTEREKGWVAGTDRSLYAGASTDPDVIATVFKLCAEELFAARSHDKIFTRGVDVLGEKTNGTA